MKITTAFCFAVAMLCSGTAFGITSGGNTAVSRDHADGWANFYMVDTNQPITSDGNLVRWELWANNSNPVALVIYRQVGSRFMVVGLSNPERPNVGFNSFRLPANFKVQARDLVGFYFPRQGSIAYTLDPPNNDSFGPGNLTGTVLFTNQNGYPAAFSHSSNRTYSIRVVGQ